MVRIPGFGGLRSFLASFCLRSPFLHFFFLFSKENSGRRQSPIGVSNFYKNRFGLERPAVEFPPADRVGGAGPPLGEFSLGFVFLFCFVFTGSPTESVWREHKERLNGSRPSTGPKEAPRHTQASGLAQSTDTTVARGQEGFS